MGLPISSLGGSLFDLHRADRQRQHRHGGVIGAGTLFVANYAFVHITYRSTRARGILEGTPSVLLRNGQPDEKAMRKEAINESELADIALEHGFSDLRKVG